MLLHGVCTTLIAYLAVVAVDSVTLDVSVDGETIAITGGYVVPERGNVTFTCSSQAVFPLWRVDLKTLGRTAGNGFSTSASLTGLQNVSTSDNKTEEFPNPSSFTVHNIPAESNGSFVECSAGSSAKIEAIILVEGSPKCPITQTRVTSKDSLVVSVQQSHKTWLPVCYHVEVTFYNTSIVTAHNSTRRNDGSVNVTSLQPGTVYNISVTPCNMAGCNRSCDIHSANTIPVGGVIVPGGGGGGFGNPLPSSLTIGLSITAVAVLVLAMAIVLVLILVLCFYRRRRDKQTKGGAEQRRIEDKSLNMTEYYAEIGHSTISIKGHSSQLSQGSKRITKHNGRREDIVAIDSTYDDVLAMSATPRNHSSSTSHLPAPPLEAGGNTEGYEVMHSAPLSLDVREERSSVDSNAAQALSQLHRHDDNSRTELQYEEHRGGWASSDVVMKANPAYEPLETAAADLETGTIESAYYI